MPSFRTLRSVAARPQVLALLVLAAALGAAPGCCARADARRSVEFASHSIARQTAVDARTTRDTVTGLPASFALHWRRSLDHLESSASLYCGK